MRISVQEAYVALGLPYGAPESDCRRAYRRLISAWHPDRNASPEAHEKTLHFNGAIKSLEDAGFPKENPDVDYSFHFRDTWQSQSERWDHFWEEETRVAARTITRKVKLTIEEAAFGTLQSLKGKTSDVCSACRGQRHTGKVINCQRCNGSGRMRGSGEYRFYGMLCPDCNGYGQFFETCNACDGSGKSPSRPYNFKVNIPPGVREGNVLVARGVGGVSSDRKTRSDARITIEIKPHSIFGFTDGGLLYLKYPVLLTELMRGDRVMVPTLYGPQPLDLRPLQFNYIIPGFGFPDRRGEPGDLHVQIDLAMPSTEDEAMKLMWRDLERHLLWRKDPRFEASRRERDKLLLYRVPDHKSTKGAADD